MLNETARNLLPIGGGHRGVVRGIGAGRTIDLAEELGRLHMLDLALQAIGEHAHLLAQGGRGCGLTVGAREHGNLAALLGQVQQNLNQLLGCGDPHVLHGILDAQGVGEVVDVFGGAAEVNQRHQVVQAQALQTATDVVLDGLHVVYGHGLNLGQLGHGFGVEIGHDGAQALLLLLAQRGQARQHLVLAQVDEPLDLDVDAVAVQGGLGEVVRQGCGDGCVASVQGAQSEFAGAQIDTARRQDGVIGVRHNSIFAWIAGKCGRGAGRWAVGGCSG